MGTVLTFIYFGLVIGYTALKFEILTQRKNVDVTLSVKDTFFNDSYAFNYEKGFNIAVALSSFDSSTE